MTYTIDPNGGVIRDVDGAFIPADPANTDYAAYLEWVEEGNTATPVPLADVQAAQWDAIKAERDRRSQTGGYYVSSASRWFHSDQASRTQQIGLVIYGANMPAGIQWKTMDGSFILMSPSLAQAIFAAAGQSDATIFAHAEALNLQMMAAADPTSVDVLAGWPLMFGE